MKSLLLGILLIIIVGVGGLVYRNAVEHPSQSVVCPMDSKSCPDGTSVSRIGSSCTFAKCLPPNISLPDIKISFALPDGFVPTWVPDGSSVVSVVAYSLPSTASPTEEASIIIHRYPIEAPSTPLATIQQTAINGASGAPVSATSFTSTVLGGYRFTVVSIERFEGVVDTAYYLARGTDVVRFDAIDRGADWTNPSLDVLKLPAHAALVKLLMTLQGQ